MTHPVLDQFRDRAVTIVGFGREGVALAPVLAAAGARLTISDAKRPEDLARLMAQVAGLPITWSLGTNDPAAVDDADFVFLSPGVPKWIPIVERAYAMEKPIWSETRLFFELCPAPVIGITGSSGKTTTTSLIGHLLQAAGRETIVGGNIGRPLIGQATAISPSALVVMELSSFQLQLLDRSPHVAVVTTVTPDHLDVHRSMEEYAEAKRNIVRYQRRGDVAILNWANPVTRSYAEGIASDVLWFAKPANGSAGVWIEDDTIVARLPGGQPTRIAPVDAVGLRGAHNLANACAATAAVLAAGVQPEDIAIALPGFQAPEHRLELVRQVGGVRFYNDSIATSPERAGAGIRSFPEPLHLIAGGRSKKLDMADFGRLVAERCRTVLLIGESAGELRDAVVAARPAGDGPEIVMAGDLAAALDAARQRARAGDIVLLSPAYTSFDQFPDYAARGQAFKDLVMALPADETEAGRG